jgi:hypothetical protein
MSIPKDREDMYSGPQPYSTLAPNVLLCSLIPSYWVTRTRGGVSIPSSMPTCFARFCKLEAFYTVHQTLTALSPTNAYNL